jgi:hypothetical protein
MLSRRICSACWFNAAISAAMSRDCADRIIDDIHRDSSSQVGLKTGVADSRIAEKTNKSATALMSFPRAIRLKYAGLALIFVLRA